MPHYTLTVDLGIVWPYNRGMMNKEHIEIEARLRQVLKEAMLAQIEKPTRAVVNSEAAFVAQRLRNDGYTGLATRYWSWTCARGSKEEFGEEIFELQQKLKEIDSGVTMPSWGTYGT